MAIEIIRSNDLEVMKTKVNAKLQEGYACRGGLTFDGNYFYQECVTDVDDGTPYNLLYETDLVVFQDKATAIHAANPKALALGELLEKVLNRYYIQAFGREKADNQPGEADGTVYTVQPAPVLDVDGGILAQTASAVIEPPLGAITANLAVDTTQTSGDGRLTIGATLLQNAGNFGDPYTILANTTPDGSSITLDNTGDVRLPGNYVPQGDNSLVTKKYSADGTVYTVDADGHALVQVADSEGNISINDQVTVISGARRTQNVYLDDYDLQFNSNRIMFGKDNAPTSDNTRILIPQGLNLSSNNNITIQGAIDPNNSTTGSILYAGSLRAMIQGPNNSNNIQLKKDGTIIIDGTYEPTLDNSIPTKKYVDDNAGASSAVYTVDGSNALIYPVDPTDQQAYIGLKAGTVMFGDPAGLFASMFGTYSTFGNPTCYLSFSDAGIIQLVGADFQCGGSYVPINDKSIATKKYVDDHAGPTPSIATDTTAGIVKGGGNVAIATDGTMSVAVADGLAAGVVMMSEAITADSTGKLALGNNRYVNGPTGNGSISFEDAYSALYGPGASMSVAVSDTEILAQAGYVPVQDRALVPKGYVDTAVAAGGNIAPIFVDPDQNVSYAGGTYVFTSGNINAQIGLHMGTDGEIARVCNWATTDLVITFEGGAKLYTNGASTTQGSIGQGGTCTLAFKTDTWYQVA